MSCHECRRLGHGGICLFDRADAQTFSNLYTPTAAKDCRVRNAGHNRSAKPLPGKDGLIVLVTEDDLRQTVSVGISQALTTLPPCFSPFRNNTPD
jgi:hypothetical protein